MSLSGRLILSYVIIITITLILAFMALIIIARPLQNRLAALRMATQSRQAARQLNNAYQPGMSIEQLVQQLNSRRIPENVHLLLINPQGIVLSDTQNEWVGRPLLQANDLTASADLSGVFDGPTGQPFIYAAAPLGTTGELIGYAVAATARAPVLPQFITELGWGFGLAGVMALCLSLLVGVWMAQSLVKPLRRIANAAGAVAAGDYSHRLSETGPSELRQVTASFNLMAGQVQAGQQAMRDFVSNVSHELKTPLTSIQGFSQAIMEGATQDEATRRRAAGIIYEEAARMSRLVEDLLDLARIDSGQVVMRKTPLDLAQILASTVDRLLPQAVEKNIQLVKSWNSLPAIIVGDGDRLAQVFTNLLDNAIRHTPSGGRITISGAMVKGVPLVRQVQGNLVQADATTALSKRGEFAEVSIADTGPGIPSEELARIFERFYQVDKSRRRGYGAGLGLAIVKEIIEAHRGYVRAESVQGVGTKFTILLPLTEADVQTLISPRK
jgi:signal transduction histidine kinase